MALGSRASTDTRASKGSTRPRKNEERCDRPSPTAARSSASASETSPNEPNALGWQQQRRLRQEGRQARGGSEQLAARRRAGAHQLAHAVLDGQPMEGVLRPVGPLRSVERGQLEAIHLDAEVVDAARVPKRDFEGRDSDEPEWTSSSTPDSG